VQNNQKSVTNGTEKNMPTKWLDALWLKMSALYPAWDSMVGLHPYVLDENKKPTSELNSKGQAWSNELADLTGDELKHGFDSLKTRAEKSFPPSVLEFKDLCTGNEYENVLDEIITRLQDGDTYQWTNQLAFNVFMPVSGDFKTALMGNVPKLVKHRLKMIDRDSMFPLPDYSKPAIEKPKTQKGIAPEQQRQIFQSHMFSAINNHSPQLFEQPENQKSNRFVSADQNDKLSPLMKKIFSAQGTTELINKFKASDYIIPDKPLKPDFLRFSKKDWSLKYRNYKQKAIEAFTNFLVEQGVLS